MSARLFAAVLTEAIDPPTKLTFVIEPPTVPILFEPVKSEATVLIFVLFEATKINVCGI